jgi:uncharacterized protein (TIGR03067 family)
MATALGLFLAMAALSRGDGSGDPGAYLLVSADDGTDLARGEWCVVSVNSRGRELPKEIIEKADMRMTFRGNTITQKTSSPKAKARETTFQLNPSSRPKEIDWALNAQATKGIYQLENDTLKIAVAPERPKDFAGGNTVYVYTLKRVKLGAPRPADGEPKP